MSQSIRAKGTQLIRPFLILCTGLWVTGCSSAANELFDTYSGPQATRDSFVVCHGFSCRYTERVNLTDSEWSEILTMFEPDSVSAEQERERIRTAVARLEQILGPKSGTELDRRRAPNTGKRGQQDCIDESVNTMTYLTFLDRDGKLKYHTIGPAETRGKIVDGKWPSNTATITETATGQRYVVDSFFHQNGELPEVVTLSLWMTGWRPEKLPHEVER